MKNINHQELDKLGQAITDLIDQCGWGEEAAI